MRLSSRMLSGANNQLDNCDAIEYWLINARYKTGLYVDSSQANVKSARPDEDQAR
ncbi:hypothetical protein HanLR1_Chr02g0050901 [Helianthus annuus]|nr:hypothetical protein HanLR1_Chr02g0050901 [Helianthus annuus]